MSIKEAFMEKYYRHFKGNLYRLIGIAKDSETLEELVVYQALYGERQLWVRPADMFFVTHRSLKMLSLKRRRNTIPTLQFLSDVSSICIL